MWSVWDCLCRPALWGRGSAGVGGPLSSLDENFSLITDIAYRSFSGVLVQRLSRHWFARFAGSAGDVMSSCRRLKTSSCYQELQVWLFQLRWDVSRSVFNLLITNAHISKLARHTHTWTLLCLLTTFFNYFILVWGLCKNCISSLNGDEVQRIYIIYI